MLLIVHVFHCDVIGVPCKGAEWECVYYIDICILLQQWIKHIGIYNYESENNILDNSFRNVFLIIIFLSYKIFEFTWRILKK